MCSGAWEKVEPCEDPENARGVVETALLGKGVLIGST